MKKLLIVLGCLFSLCASAQTNSSFYVGGDADKFYPVTFYDAAWDNNTATHIEVGRSHVHTDGMWRGSMIAKFWYHTTNYGHGSNFISADIISSNSFVAGWRDATSNNGDQLIIIWFRGGGNTYYINSPFSVSTSVYDGAQKPLPFQETNGPAHSYKTAIEPYVNRAGKTEPGNAYFTGGGTNYFSGNVGIGTTSPQEKLSVNGKIRAQEIKVENANWPDYVFKPEYKLQPLSELEKHLKYKQHLPGIPSAKEIEKQGFNVSEMNAIMLKKIEELTLYLLQKDKEIKRLNEKVKKIERIQKNYK